MNITIEAPAGSTTHGNPKLICVPPKAIHYIIFYVTNYFAHAASIVIEPGQSLSTIIYCVVMALLLPGSGIGRALTVILRGAALEYKNDGQRAARAGALCMVVKKTENQSRGLNTLVGSPGDLGLLNTFERPNDLENQLNVIRASQTWKYEKGLEIPEGYSYMPVLFGTSIHGHQELNEEFHRYFYIGMVPPFATLQLMPAEDVEAFSESPNTKPVIASSINLVRPFISLIQAAWGAITLYRARGDQVDQYGYASFGLTVAPYVMMSILNALGNILTPAYPCMFLIRTALLEEVQERQIASFSGVVNAKFDTIQTTEPSIYLRRLRGLIARLDNWLIPSDNPEAFASLSTTSYWDISNLGLLVGLVPLAVIGSISGFRDGNSTKAERGFTMSWFVVGLLYGVLESSQARIDTFGELGGTPYRRPRPYSFFVLVWHFLSYVITVGPAVIGGMVMVGKMIRDFGICTRIG